MIRSLRLPAASACAIAVALIVAACGSSATATPTPTPAGGGGLPTGLGGLPSGLGGSGGLLGGLLGNNNPALQAKLPSQICGAPAITFSMPAGAIPASALSGLAGGAGSILSGLTGTETFSFAVASPGAAASDPCDTSYFAVQLSGGDANSFLQLMIQGNASDGGTSSTTSMAGKSVTVVTPSGGGSMTYAWVNGDTIIAVQADDDATAAAAFAALP
ncbi:MAG TPA: hypothetical protein VN771_04015 [Candidatus Baltobacteraceae bacterium]|nr:hypothetical protein [Candidatus Baltobacteraceae bacterium]